MPISAPGCKRRAAGFTLIEMMIVVLIMSITVGLVSINLGVLDRRNTADEVERLQRVMQFASERAAVRGTPIQIEFLPASYRFSVLDTNGRWQLLFSPRELVEHNWDAGLAVRALSIDGKAASEGDLRLQFGAEATPFQLDLSTPDGRARIVGNSAGEILLNPPADASKGQQSSQSMSAS
jgi:general secretion pathway protein H